MPGETSSLPIVDLARAKTDPEAEGRWFVEVMDKTGFAFIDNVEGLDFAGIEACCKWLFGQSDEFKQTIYRKQWNPDNDNVYRGFFPLVPGKPTRMEGFEFGRDVFEADRAKAPTNWFYEQCVWPQEDGTLSFKELMQEQYEVLHGTCMQLLRLSALGLGLPEETFTKYFKDKPCSSLRMLHYPPWENKKPENAVIEDGKVISMLEHTDTEMMTLLMTFGFGGLEVKQSNGEWLPIKPRPGSLVMNIGDLFTRMVGGKFKPTLHRVVDLGVDRYSVPFFFAPEFDTDIRTNVLPGSKEEWSEGVAEDGEERDKHRYGEWLIHTRKNVKKYVEWTNLPEIKA